MKIPRSRILSLLVSHVLFIGRGTPKLLKNVLFIEANTLFSGLGVLSPSIIFNIITYIYKMCHIKIHITWYLYFVNSFATSFLKKYYAVIFSNSSLNNSSDVLKPKIPRGYVFIQFSINSMSLSCFSSKSSPLGIWRRISLLVFSLVPLS